MIFKGLSKKTVALKDGQKENLDREVYLEGIISSMMEALIVINPDATLRSINKAALDTFGYK